MTSVGAYEAKTHLAGLLERVAAGETITITRHGREIAKLVPADPTLTDSAPIIEALKQARQGVRRGPVATREMIDEGRR